MRYEDKDFIYSSWLRSYRPSKANVGLDSDVYYERHSNRINAILQRAGTRVVVASNPEDDDHLFGYIVFEIQATKTILHYIYVKQSYRQLGLARRMLEILDAGQKLTASHYPANDKIFAKFRSKGINYDPETQ